MTSVRVERRLTAIMAADVAGYSRLTGLDEEGTHVQLQDHLRILIEPKIAEHRGRLVKKTGDGILAEFGSVVDAMRCGLDLQQGMVERNADVPEEKRIEFRIGVNVGDIMIDRGDIFGNGVNVAARLESLAEPGGICISEDAYRQVQNKVSAEFADIGEQRLKNIARPVRAYRVVAGDRRSLARSSSVTVPSLSIIVLPFLNMGGNQEQEYFVDGITESLTTDLSRIPDSFVIARNTAFTFKGKPVDVKKMGRELGVNYVVEGSVQRSGNRLRLNVQLIDARTGSHLWAERFDREQTDLFQMQDEIVGRLARSLDVELTTIMAQSASHSENPVSLDYIFRARAALNRGLTADAQAEALHYFEMVTAMEPNNHEAWAGIAMAHANIVGNFMTDDRAKHLAAGEAAAMKAIMLSPNNPRAHLALGNIYRSSNRAPQAISELERALAIDRNLVGVPGLIGIAKIGVGRSEEVEDHIAQAIRLSPRDSMMHAWCIVAGAAKLLLAQDDEAIRWLQRSTDTNRAYPLPHFYLAVAFAHQGKLVEARLEIEAGLILDPTFTLHRLRESAYSDNPVYLAQRERLYDGLQKAGLPQ